MDKTIKHFGIASAAAGGAALAICAAPVGGPGILLGTLAAGAGGYAGSQLADAIDDLFCELGESNPSTPSEEEAPPAEEAAAAHRGNHKPNWVFYEEPSIAYSLLEVYSATALWFLPGTRKGSCGTP